MPVHVPESEGTSPIPLAVVLNTKAPAGLQDFAQQYWDLSGVDVDSGDPQWRFKTTTLDFARWSGMAHYAAAAGATALVEDYLCGTCDGPLTLISRQALLDAIRGDTTECRSCNEQVDQQAAKILRGEGLEKRAAKLLERERTASAEEARTQLELKRRTYVEAKYLVEDDSEEYLLDEASVFARVGVLSVVSATGDHGGMLMGVHLHDASIAPSFELRASSLVATSLWRHGVLSCCKSTPRLPSARSCGRRVRLSAQAQSTRPRCASSPAAVERCRSD